MDSNLLIIMIGICYICTIIFVRLLSIQIFGYLNQKQKIKTEEVKNNQYNLFMQIDAELVEGEIDKLIKKYLNEYVLYEIIMNNIDYVRKDKVEEMIRYLDKKIMIEISELYIFYIKLLRNINNDEDLLEYVNKKVKEHVLNFVTDFNSPKE